MWKREGGGSTLESLIITLATIMLLAGMVLGNTGFMGNNGPFAKGANRAANMMKQY